MPRAHVLPLLGAALVWTTILAGPACAQDRPSSQTVGDLLVPGGIAAAAAVVGHRAPASEPYFLLDLIRRFHASPDSAERVSAQLRQLLAHLDAQAGPSVDRSEPPPTRQLPGNEGRGDTLPLPLAGPTWTDVVLAGRTSPGRLFADILRTRSTALFYYGLMSLDDETRAWLAGEPSLIADLSTRDAVRFVVAAPALRVATGRILPPGGERAEPGWEALVGRPMAQPGEFVRALLAAADGRLAAFYGAMAPLSPAQWALAFDLEAGVPARIAAAEQLFRVFEQLMGTWRVDDDAFRRPAFDPAMLLADLSLDEHGTPRLPGTAAFWGTVLEDLRPATTPRSGEAAEEMVDGPPVAFPWLCERLLGRGQFQYRRAHLMVLFASRIVTEVTGQNALDAVDAVRAAGTYPALSKSLERAGVTEVAVYAATARRAAQLSRITDNERAARSIAQFQGAVFLVARAAVRAGWPSSVVDGVMSSLARVEPGARGDYEGRMVEWLTALVASSRPRITPSAGAPGRLGGVASEGQQGAHNVAPLDREVLDLVSGARGGAPGLVDWEGSRYRVDFGTAETTRLGELLGDAPRPYLATAGALVDLARQVGAAGPAGPGASSIAASLDELRRASAWEDDLRTALERCVRNARAREPSRLADAMRLLADDLLARGLVTYAYAVALGEPGRTPVSAGEVARRHGFGPPEDARAAAWRFATVAAGDGSAWHLNGSILGLDVVLAERALVATSEKPPARPPTIDPPERRAFAEAVVLVSPASLTDADLERIRASLRRGRDRIARVRSASEARAVADAVHASPERRTLLAWTAARRPEALPVVLAPVQLFWLGSEGDAPGTMLDHWGAPADGRTGCLCLHLDTPRWLDPLGGRWGAAVLASGFPDLNLRLAELLGDLGMPASLLAAVLSPATFDLVTTAHMGDRDDRRGLEAFVHGLTSREVEQYLALLTTGGPLVPVDDPASERLGPAPGERR